MRFRLSRDAANDLKEIYRYSFRQFGEAQADRYFAALDDCFALICQHPRLGRDYGRVKPDVRRHEHLRHSIYYRVAEDHVLILRVLGSERDPARHL